jgi:NAD(P)H dehydrogenase (quinone)
MAHAQTTVVVAFFSRCGTTEALALAAAVGAVQRRALIRLRRLPDDGAPPAGQDSPECQDALIRMRKEYVAPTEADVTGNDALILTPPAGSTTDSIEWAEFLGMLARLAAEGKLAGKVGAIVDAGSEETLQSFSSLISRLGLRLVAPDAAQLETPGDLTQQARACGRRVAAAAASH